MNDIEIIIPAYNAHETIIKTLESIIVQRTNLKYEVCISNDNPKDNYEKEIDFFKKYINIKSITMKKNGGPGLARQYAIDNTKSKYIIFIDSDDYLYSPYSLEKLYNCITKYNSDLGITGFIYERDSERKIITENLTWLHGKIYKREFLENNKIKFNDTRANEDNGFNRLIFLLGPKISCSNDVTYVYQENPNSITRKENRLYKFTGIEWFVYNIKWAIEESLKRKENKEEILKLSVGCLVSLHAYYLELKDKYDGNKILLWSKCIKEIYDKYKENPMTDYITNIYIEKKLTEIKEKNIKYTITFNEFLERVEKSHD